MGYARACGDTEIMHRRITSSAFLLSKLRGTIQGAFVGLALAAFLPAHPEFEPLSCKALLEAQHIAVGGGAQLRLWPQQHSTDGFFAAAFLKRPLA